MECCKSDVFVRDTDSCLKYVKNHLQHLRFLQNQYTYFCNVLFDWQSVISAIEMYTLLDNTLFISEEVILAH